MVQCEMCGTSTSSPKTVKVEGAELEVCADCADFGTEVQTQDAGSSSSTKYSTNSGGTSDGSSGGGSGGAGTASSSGGDGSSSPRRSDMFDDMDELATDYDDRIRNARESEGLSQSDLADELNEKASLIRKLERGETLPSDQVQSKLERRFDISLSGGVGTDDDAEWDGGGDAGEYTLGDVVKRKE